MPPCRYRFGLVIVVLSAALAGCGSAGVTSKPVTPEGADPAVWAGTLCGGLGDVIAGVSAIAKAQPTPQGQKDGLLEFSDIAQQAFADTAHKLQVLGQPRIADSKRIQDAAVGFFTTAAGTIGGQRAKLAALDAKDPDFVQKASHLAGPDLDGASGQMRQLTSNKELAPAFQAAPACRRLGTAAGHR